MKYTDEILKQYDLAYSIVYDEETLAPIIIVKNYKGDSKKYKIITTSTFNADYLSDFIDETINKFIVELRKEKLIRLNEIF